MISKRTFLFKNFNVNGMLQKRTSLDQSRIQRLNVMYWWPVSHDTIKEFSVGHGAQKGD